MTQQAREAINIIESKLPPMKELLQILDDYNSTDDSRLLFISSELREKIFSIEESILKAHQ